MNPFQFAADPFAGTGVSPTGFGTPASDLAPQICHVPPRRVIPIIFLPGIMGSNLMVTTEARIDLLRRKKGDKDRNIAWRPDTFGLGNAFAKSNITPADRQLMLDPATTAVDIYNPDSTDSEVDGDQRNRNVELSGNYASPLLADDTIGPNRRTASQKARMRGWGEVYFDSYGELLQRVESRMQTVFRNGKLADGWDQVIGVDPRKWNLDPSTPQSALTVEELKAITKNTFFPVHAIGYNWLVDNRLSANDVAGRIRKIVQTYTTTSVCGKCECPGVIIVTHSMGGLLGRALIHPGMGGLQDLVLGIVHGVQPATGAAAAYRRMRAGFEAPEMRHFKDSVGVKIAGNYGDEVTPVLANSPGGLQLLPSRAYGQGWLRVHAGDRELLSLPAKGDPYEEIYKLRGKWYGLIPHESWINPANVKRDDGATPIQQAHKCIDSAREFHDVLGDTYHAHTYVHYGADRHNLAFGNVTWQLSKNCGDLTDWKNWSIVDDTRQGTVFFQKEELSAPVFGNPELVPIVSGKTATVGPQDEPGDQTVPMRSADRPKQLGKCKAVFRQTGYDHQSSYKNEAALASTLYSILRISQRVQLP